eukprot:3625281-Rhodomonas_salina.1
MSRTVLPDVGWDTAGVGECAYDFFQVVILVTYGGLKLVLSSCLWSYAFPTPYPVAQLESEDEAMMLVQQVPSYARAMRCPVVTCRMVLSIRCLVLFVLTTISLARAVRCPVLTSGHMTQFVEVPFRDSDESVQNKVDKFFAAVVKMRTLLDHEAALQVIGPTCLRDSYAVSGAAVATGASLVVHRVWY